MKYSVHFFASGDFQEGNGANSRFVCYGIGLNELQVENTFHFVLPSEFNDSGINKNRKGKYQGISYNYLCNTSRRKSNLVLRLGLLLVSWLNAFKVLSKLHVETNVVYFYGPQAFIHGPIILFARLFGLKVVIEKTEFHSLAQGESKGIKAVMIKTAYRIIEQNLHLICDRVIVISRRLKKYYAKKMGGDRISHIPVIFDPSRFESNYFLRSNTVGYIGSFGHKDGVAQIIEAFSHCIKKNDQLKLRLVGYQNKSFDLEAELEKHGLSSHPNIEITGQVYSSQIPKLLGECDLLVMNRVNTPYANYGFPTKLAEYLATGRPVIATNVSDISYYFRSGTELKIIEPDNVEQLSTAILDRYNKYDEWSEIGRKGKEEGNRLFNFRKHIAMMDNLFQDVLYNEKPVKTGYPSY